VRHWERHERTPAPVRGLTGQKGTDIIGPVKGRVLLFLCLAGALCGVPSRASGVPTLRETVWLEHTSGERIAAQAVGDERAFYWRTTDGWVLRPSTDGRWERWTELGLWNVPRRDLHSHAGRARPVPGMTERSGRSSPGPPVQGEIPVLAIAVEFSDMAAGATLEGVADMLDGDQHGSVKHFYEEVSYGTASVAATSPQTGWYVSSHTMAYYGADSYPGVDNANGYISELAREALILADPDVDFTLLDLDGNGRLDAGEVHIVVVHAGDDQASSHRAGDIWSHRWWIWGSPYGSPDTYLDGVLVSEPNTQGNETSPGYVMIAETDVLGVIAHELFHSLGGPDLYDPDGDTHPWPVGYWCLMGMGVWNGSPAGTSPSHPCGYLKMDANADPSDGLGGWLAPLELTVSDQYAVRSLEANASGSVYLARIPGDREYFVLENRVRTGYDGALPGQGILVFHVDEDMPSFNEDWDPPYPRVWLEDPGGDSRKRTAAFSAENGYTEFTPDTDPGSATNDGVSSGIFITSVSSSGEEMTFMYGSPEPIPVATRIASCYPNPFTAGCSFTLHVGQDAAGGAGSAGSVLDVYNVVGQKTARVWEGVLSGGSHTVTWDGTDLTGRRASPGMYVAVAKVGGRLATRRVLLIPPEDQNP
jgi:immune inhibitor A